MWTKESNLLIYLVILALSLNFSCVTSKRDKKEECKTCKEIVEAFYKGMEKTVKANFGGGNTAWEERKLGSYATSETRLVEILEGLCESSASLCHSLVEEHEEALEKWWFKLQNKEKDLKTWFCINNIEVCCNNGTFGPDCKECPSGKDDPCHGHGDCDGAGTRGGKGSCSCHDGYEGDECDECADDYFEEKDENDKMKCSSCHESCSKGCSGATAKDCTECKTGWEKTEEEGCKDVDECQDADKCNEGELCVNTPGSFSCDACHESCDGACTSAGPKGCKVCKSGYNITEDEGCKDIDECAEDKSSSLCSSGTYCKNTPGSYECESCNEACETCIGEGVGACTKCNVGFKRIDNECKDIDECAAEKKPCTLENEVCKNSIGSYTCECRNGYGRKGEKCVKGEKDSKVKRVEEESDEDDEEDDDGHDDDDDDDDVKDNVDDAKQDDSTSNEEIKPPEEPRDEL
ncbi:cysteine-rich with EGF-like domain protein 2 isoform X2 [Actinia tenebrosa]|uniref:Cysteine-rich with EGF-like domain protein 2 isoform X2 n=1 Tax=Actinia tenebrosa TaxID=6105 RepID=A0A6P8IX78_ACTTE|nr:cysteine-rich with EGF-like domain protein 2 isoform X2 [Actinia tenebrosa]